MLERGDDLVPLAACNSCLTSIERASSYTLVPVPTGNIELNENMEFAPPLSSPPPGARGTSYLSRRRVSCLQVSSHAPSGESRTSAPTRSAATLGEAAFPDVSRSTPVGVSVRSLERLAARLGHRQAGDRDRKSTRL